MFPFIKMSIKEMQKKSSLEDTPLVAFIELFSAIIGNILLFFVMYLIVWPNNKLNETFNNGIGLYYHGWQCSDEIQNSGKYCFVLFQISILCLHVPSLILLYFDYYYEKHNLLSKYKVYYPLTITTTNKKQFISWPLYRKSIFLANTNAIIAGIVFPLLFIPLMELRGVCDRLLFEHDRSIIISFLFIIFRMYVCLFVSDIIFYFSHRCIHKIKFFYKYIHKIHHQFVDTFGISATAAHPLEHIFANLMTVVGAPIVVNLPLIPYFIWIWIGCLNTTFSHSGYGNPFRRITFGNAIPHDYHHHYQNCEYGVGSILCDKLFKTQLKDMYPNRWKQICKHYKKPIN
eukprot:2803_1